jgi:thiol-disulfide isomerase/thioredoxin
MQRQPTTPIFGDPTLYTPQPDDFLGRTSTRILKEEVKDTRSNVGKYVLGALLGIGLLSGLCWWAKKRREDAAKEEAKKAEEEAKKAEEEEGTVPAGVRVSSAYKNPYVAYPNPVTANRHAAMILANTPQKPYQTASATVVKSANGTLAPYSGPSIGAPYTASASGVVSAQPVSARQASIVTLTDTTFGGAVSQGKTLAAFTAPGCSWCIKFSPDFKTAAGKVPASTAKFAFVNAAAAPTVIRKYGIQGFPTVLKIQDGNVVATYSGDRTVNDLIRFAHA